MGVNFSLSQSFNFEADLEQEDLFSYLDRTRTFDMRSGTLIAFYANDNRIVPNRYTTMDYKNLCGYSSGDFLFDLKDMRIQISRVEYSLSMSQSSVYFCILGSCDKENWVAIEETYLIQTRRIIKPPKQYPQPFRFLKIMISPSSADGISIYFFGKLFAMA